MADKICKSSTNIIAETLSLSNLTDTIAPGNSKEYTLPLAKTGYIPLGILAIYKGGSGNGIAVISRYYITSTNNAVILFSNPNGNTGTANITSVEIKVLYVKV